MKGKWKKSFYNFIQWRGQNKTTKAARSKTEIVTCWDAEVIQQKWKEQPCASWKEYCTVGIDQGHPTK